MSNFVVRTFKSYPELVPLASFIGLAVGGGIVSIVYSIFTKSDVIVNKNKETPPWELIKGDQDRKLFTINQKYKEIPELEELKKDIGSYKY
ncbi:normal mucosa of esophagus-specific gene 1 protein-like [Gigantopelta aegis]|uniref:normal mucosa of esophagus-specific gene 1 protein-like n=1 Tax=Gigantopelta aegis TaxID=1735272 RepID=UPI001B88C8A7|nr:normal mucosa of esophagus-specific gene 1 protein-like [Gigantopelta aegis]